MPRYAKRTTDQELRDLIYLKVTTDKFPYCVEKDVNKIDFDFENIAFDGRNFSSYSDDKSSYDIHTLPNGLVYCLCSAGGDWEVPVSFILYIDPNNQLRAYVPENGNVYNKEFKCAYGSEGEHQVPDFDDPDWEPAYTADDHNEDDLDMQLFEADVTNRIIVK